MNASAGRLARISRTVYHGRNKLARPSDHFEAWLVIFLVVLALAALPFAAALGSDTYAQRKALSDQQIAQRYQVTATLLTDGPPVTVNTAGVIIDQSAPAKATWPVPGNGTRAGTVDAPAGAKAGAPLRIWLDQTGAPTTKPLSRVDAAADSFGLAAGLWGGVALVLGALYLLVRRLLDRGRLDQWEREWAEVDQPRSFS